MLFQKMSTSIKLKHVQCLLYADCIVKFLKLNPKLLKKHDASKLVCPYSELIGNKILDTFTVPPGRYEYNTIRKIYEYN